MPAGTSPGSRKTQFQKGQSGNPNGQKGKPVELKQLECDIKQLARSRAVEAINVLAELMNSARASTSARVAAATAILDRGYGKPVQALSGPENGLIQITKIECVIVDPEHSDRAGLLPALNSRPI